MGLFQNIATLIKVSDIEIVADKSIFCRFHVIMMPTLLLGMWD